MVRRIVERVDPVAIYLFGSRARGDADAESDYDLMIVVPDESSNDAAIQRPGSDPTRKFDADPTSFCLDARYRRKSEFASRCLLLGTLEAEANAGIVLYKNESVQLRPTKPTKEEIFGEARRLAGNAQFCLDGYSRRDGTSVDPRHTIREAAELLINAALVANQVRPFTTDKIGALAEVLPESFPLRPALRSLRWARVNRRGEINQAGTTPVFPADDELEANSKYIAALIHEFERWMERRAGGTRGDA